MRYLFLSPHYDDAIYSCAGTIYELTQNGHEVEIFTLMAEAPAFPIPDTPVLKDNHQRWQAGDNPVLARRNEDKAAAAIVGASTRYYDLPDCIYRMADGIALYPSEESLWTQIHPDDPAIPALQSLTLKQADLVFAPLGVGEHVDHLIIRDWAWQLAQNASFPVQFYVEYPYLRNRETVEKAYQAFPAKLSPVKRRFSEQAMQQKINAMSAYQSQIKSFWDNENEIDNEVRQSFSENGYFVEEYAEAKYS